MNFKNLKLDEALRLFLEEFTLPGEVKKKKMLFFI